MPVTQNIGDNETPGSIAPVDLGPGRTATAISAGSYHTCVILDDGSVRCWGSGPDGPVDLGPAPGRSPSTPGASTPAPLLDDGTVRCWGAARSGKLGYGNLNDIGDDEAPGSAGPVDLGPGRRATAITAGTGHTCAALDDGRIRCWGTHEYGAHGQYGHPWPIGDDETPGQRPPVNLDGMISVAPGVPLDVVAEWVGPGHVTLTVDGARSGLGADQPVPHHVGVAGSDQAHAGGDDDHPGGVPVRALSGRLPVHGRRRQPCPQRPAGDLQRGARRGHRTAAVREATARADGSTSA